MIAEGEPVAFEVYREIKAELNIAKDRLVKVESERDRLRFEVEKLQLRFRSSADRSKHDHYMNLVIDLQ